MNTTNPTETATQDGPDEPSLPTEKSDAPRDDARLAREAGMWLLALRSFFNPRNHPFNEAERASILSRDFARETRIAHDALIRIAQLIHGLDASTRPDSLKSSNVDAARDSSRSTTKDGAARSMTDELSELAEAIGDARDVCDGLLAAPSVDFQSWASFGKLLARELSRSEAARLLMREARSSANAPLQTQLRAMVEHLAPDALAADMHMVFSDLALLLGRLLYIEDMLRRDQPLKQMLPIFTLVHEEAHAFIEFIQTRAMRTEGLDDAVFDALDGTSYAVGMELRKAFEHELVGVSASRQAPAVYARVENAHGLLRDCFQQSTVALAQIFEPALDGTHLFTAFQTKLDQSLQLRRDLWTLLEFVRRTEKERDQRMTTPLLEHLEAFQAGSLRFLMYKDWEAFERFVDEVTSARGTSELTPVLHRFVAYLETLFGQINMRAVLAEHPFEYTNAEG